MRSMLSSVGCVAIVVLGSSLGACSASDGSSGSSQAGSSGTANAGGAGAAVGTGATGSGGTGAPERDGTGATGSGGTGSPGGAGGGVGSGSVGGASGASGAGAAGGTGGAGGGGESCGAFPPAGSLASPGPFGFVSAPEGPACTIWRPNELGKGGVRHPVIVWGNGTGGPIAVYGPAFELWASHGFIVAGANASNGQGSGAQMVACLDHVLAQSTTAGSVYQGKVCSRAGASGHSQGGGGALMAGRDPRVIATAPLMPYIADGFGGFARASLTLQSGAMLLLSGTADNIAAPDAHQQPVFDATNVPVFWANLVNGNHVTVSFGIPTYREPMLAWFRLQLMGDESFRSMFYGAACGLCQDPAWIVQRRSIK